MEFDIEKIVVQARYLMLKARWTYELEVPPPRAHGPMPPMMIHKVVLNWDSVIQNAGEDILLWLLDRFPGADQYYYHAVFEDSEDGTQRIFWVFHFAKQTHAIEFKLRWG
jgi:hypothetical protein